MSNELIPELHDCLKLTTLQHNFSDFDRFFKFTPVTRTWQGVLQHHCKIPKKDGEAFPAFPTDRETFLLHMADSIASNFSRHEQNYKGENAFVLHKIWNPHEVKEDLRLKSDDEIIKLLKFYSSDPTFEELVREYGYILKSRAEDAKSGKNITSLLTHLTLTGKFYRFFKNSKVLTVDSAELIPELGKIHALTVSKSNKWQIYFMLCKLNFNQQPFRARDLNIFELLEDTMNAIAERFHDNILFASSEEFLIFYDELSVFEEIRDIALKNGFWLSVERARISLTEIKKMKKPDIDSLPRKESIKNIFSSSLPEKIEPPLCEICQMEHGRMTWPGDYLLQYGFDEDIESQGTDHLCENCFSIRKKPSRLRKLKHWTDFGANVIWLRVVLDYKKLTSALEQLYFEYLQKLNPKASRDDAQVRFSLVHEFQQDYNYFLNALKGELINAFLSDNVETLLRDMFCIKAESKTDVFAVLELLNNLLKSLFPELLKKLDNPMKASLSFCSSKHPFFEIWREIKEQTSDLQINLVGKGSIKTTYKYIDDIILARNEKYRKSALHNLAEIAKISEKLAEIKFNDRSEKNDFYSYEALKRHLLPIGMDFRSILTFVKLLEG